MKYNNDKKKVFRSAAVLIIGAILVTGGVFLWQNQFNFSLFPNAATNTVQAVVLIGETSTSDLPPYALEVKNYLAEKQTEPIELINRAEDGTAISTLRDQAVLGYNDITKPITDHVLFLVFTGKSALINGIKDKSSVASISTKISKEISALIDLASARPGVFPGGYTVYLATLPDPLDGTGDVTLCNGSIPNYGKEYTKGVLKEINSSIRSTAAIYTLNIKIVDLEKDFANNGLASSKSWFNDCLTLNDEGKAAMAASFKNSVQKGK